MPGHGGLLDRFDSFIFVFYIWADKNYIMKKINVVIFGVTGSIGKSVLSIINQNSKYINIEGATCDSNIKKLFKIADTFNISKIGFNEKVLKKTDIIKK